MSDLIEQVKSVQSGFSEGNVTLDDLLLTDYAALRQQTDEHYISYEALTSIIDPNSQFTYFKKAYDMAMDHHKDQIRKYEKVPFAFHLDRILLMMGMFGVHDEETYIAAVLHDVLDNPNGKSRTEMSTEIIQKFSNQVYDLVHAMSDDEKIDEIAGRNWVKNNQIQRMISKSHTIAHWIIHTLDRLDNLRDAKNYGYSTRRMKLEETWSYYLPMAEAMNLNLGRMMTQLLERFDYNPVSIDSEHRVQIYRPAHLSLYHRLLKGGILLDGLDKSSNPFQIPRPVHNLSRYLNEECAIDLAEKLEKLNFVVKSAFHALETMLPTGKSLTRLRKSWHPPHGLREFYTWLRDQGYENKKSWFSFPNGEQSIGLYQMTFQTHEQQQEITDKIEEEVAKCDGARIVYYAGKSFDDDKLFDTDLWYVINIETQPTIVHLKFTSPRNEVQMGHTAYG